MKKILLIAMLAIASLGFSQTKATAPLEKFARVNLGLHGLEMTYELPIGGNFVWENSLGLGAGSSSAGSDVTYYLYLDTPVPFFSSELKFLYNRAKRTQKGRSTMNNSGNYIGLQTKYSFGNESNLDLNQSLLTELHWGIQRPLGKRFLFDFHIGLGYLADFDFEEGNLSPALGLRFGYKLF